MVVVVSGGSGDKKDKRNSPREGERDTRYKVTKGTRKGKRERKGRNSSPSQAKPAQATSAGNSLQTRARLPSLSLTPGFTLEQKGKGKGREEEGSE